MKWFFVIALLLLSTVEVSAKTIMVCKVQHIRVQIIKPPPHLRHAWRGLKWTNIPFNVCRPVEKTILARKRNDRLQKFATKIG